MGWPRSRSKKLSASPTRNHDVNKHTRRGRGPRALVRNPHARVSGDVSQDTPYGVSRGETSPMTRTPPSSVTRTSGRESYGSRMRPVLAPAATLWHAPRGRRRVAPRSIRSCSQTGVKLIAVRTNEPGHSRASALGASLPSGPVRAASGNSVKLLVGQFDTVLAHKVHDLLGRLARIQTTGRTPSHRRSRTRPMTPARWCNALRTQPLLLVQKSAAERLSRFHLGNPKPSAAAEGVANIMFQLNETRRCRLPWWWHISIT